MPIERLEAEAQRGGGVPRGASASTPRPGGGAGPDREARVADVCASFQHTVIETLFAKTRACADTLGLKTLTIAGGVSANSALRERFQQFVDENPNYRLFIPRMPFCTDNAAMVGASAYFNPISTSWDDEVFSRQLMPANG